MLEKKNQVSTIFLYRKINNKKVTDNDLIDWRAYGVETLTKPKQTKPKRKHKQNLGIRLYSCYRLRSRVKDLDSYYGESVKGVLDSGVRVV